MPALSSARFVIQLFTIILGCAGLAWGGVVLPIFWQHSAIERTASQIISGRQFRPDAIVGLLPALEAVEEAHFCRPIARRSAAIIRLRVAEDAFAAGQTKMVDAHMLLLRRSIRSALECAPSDSFLWLMLFWTENTRNGFSSEHLNYLRMSYRLGPNEGWIAVRRSHIALALFEHLPPDLREAAVKDFARLVDSGLYDEAIAILVGPGWPLRDILVRELSGVADRHRRAIAKRLYERGYDIVVPGIPRPGSTLPN